MKSKMIMILFTAILNLPVLVSSQTEQEDYLAIPDTLVINKKDQVVQIIDEKNSEILYSRRINGNVFIPKVFKKGNYTIHVGEGISKTTLEEISSINVEGIKSINIEL